MSLMFVSLSVQFESITRSPPPSLVGNQSNPIILAFEGFGGEVTSADDASSGPELADEREYREVHAQVSHAQSSSGSNVDKVESVEQVEPANWVLPLRFFLSKTMRPSTSSRT
jgi:hypothetical protein